MEDLISRHSEEIHHPQIIDAKTTYREEGSMLHVMRKALIVTENCHRVELSPCRIVNHIDHKIR